MIQKTQPSLLARCVLGLVRFYRLVLSPLIPPRCRYSPTCSEYALEAVQLHGGLRGLWLAIRRVMRCHPFGGHGFDPVPGPSHRQDEKDTGPDKQLRDAQPGSKL